MDRRLQRNMKRRGGKREGAGRKKSPALTKITREINQKHWRNKSPLYIFGKLHFLNLTKGSCGGNLRKRFELRVHAAAWFGAQTKTSFGTRSIISSTRKTSSRTLFSTGRASVLATTWVWFLNLDNGEVVETKL